MTTLRKVCAGTLPTKTTNDTTPPRTPRVEMAIAFEVAKGDASVQTPPPAPPAGGSWRRTDPVLMQLLDIEPGAKLVFASLSDHPDLDEKKLRAWLGDPAAQAAGDPPFPIYHLDTVGYDQNANRATCLIDDAGMADKGVTAGENLAVFQVDRNGNVCLEPLYLHLDPSGFATQTIRTTNADGAAISARGQDLSYQVGIHGVTGVDQAVGASQLPQMQRVIALAVNDTTGPAVINRNISVDTIKWSAEEKGIATQLLSPVVWQEVQRKLSGQLTVANMTAVLNTPANYQFGERTLDVFKKLVDNPALFARFDAAANGPKTVDGVIADVDLTEVRDNARTAFIKIDRALEIGAQGTITVHPNNGNGDGQFPFSIDASRVAYVKAPKTLDNGSTVVVEFTDRAGNAGKPVSFEYDMDARAGRVDGDALAAQAGQLSNVAVKTLQVGDKQVKRMPLGLAPPALKATEPLYASSEFFIFGPMATAYETNFERLGLPKGNQQVASTNGAATGLVQEFAMGRIKYDNATRQATVELSPVN